MSIEEIEDRMRHNSTIEHKRRIPEVNKNISKLKLPVMDEFSLPKRDQR